VKAKISDIFVSVQGEGIYLGERQCFVRFFGCNLNCKFCDTKLKDFYEYDAESLVSQIRQHKKQLHSVSYTGGEPLLQKEFLKEVLPLTRREGLKNYLESNGTLPNELSEVIEHIDIISMDIKLPSSTGLRPFWAEHQRFLKIASQREVFVKAVVCEETRDEDLVETARLIREINKSILLVLQPNSFEASKALQDKIERFKCLVGSEGITACGIPQIHKIIGIE